MNKIRWQQFISGFGVEKLIEVIENLKRQAQSIFKKGNRRRWLIHTIRLEHLQIKKHQKLSMKYLQELEELLPEVEMKEDLRKNYRQKYAVK